MYPCTRVLMYSCTCYVLEDLVREPFHLQVIVLLRGPYSLPLLSVQLIWSQCNYF